jgi:septum site-determining protein MinC
VSLALAARSKLRFAGRSFLAFVLEPSRPIAAWLGELDDLVGQSLGFFANRPVILDLAKLAPSKAETAEILDALAARSIRVIAVEGIDPGFAPPALAPLSGGVGSAKVVDFPGGGDARRRAEPPPEARRPTVASMLIDKPVRSGQSIFFPHGDLTVLGAVASGAEVIAGGSLHIVGALRGRAFAGASGNTEARIFCRRFEAELVAIDGCYLTSERYQPELLGKPVQIRLDDGTVAMGLLD